MKNNIAFATGFSCILLLTMAASFAFFSSSLTKGRNSPVMKRSQRPNDDLRLEDVFLSVKTSRKFHETRIPVIIQTWFTLAREHVWFFTDRDDLELARKTGGHLSVTRCGTSHKREHLCCKMGAELDAFLDSDRKWFCHFDDDNYVNPFALLRKLKGYDYRQDWYLGKPSLRKPVRLAYGRNQTKKLEFWFGTGGAGVCLSKPATLRMIPMAGNGRFESLCDMLRLPDDVTIGYLMDLILNTPLTVVPEFHSHLEPQRFIVVDSETFSDQVSFGYGYHRSGDIVNTVNITGIFSKTNDPTRFKSIHCKLFPNFSWCPKGRNNP